MKELIELLFDYIDAKIDYKIEFKKEGRTSCRFERKRVEEIKNEIMSFISKYEEDYK